MLVAGIFSPVLALADKQQGASCTEKATAGIANNTVDDGNNLVCISGHWQYPSYAFQTGTGTAGSSCTGYPTGAMRYNSTLTNMEFCDGTNWRFLAASTTACGSPSGLTFTNLTGQSLSTSVTSSTATITFTGCSGGGLSVSVSGAATAQISINGGAWGTSGSITSGQTLQVRMTTSGSVSTTLTATVTVGGSSTNWTTTTRAGSLQMFASSGGYAGNSIGGLSGADANCQAEAGSLGYAGTYKAVMSDETTNAKDRLTLSYPIVRASDGVTIAATKLWGTPLSNAVSSGACANGYCSVWTGTQYDGTKASGMTCSSWTGAGGSNNYSGGETSADYHWIFHDYITYNLAYGCLNSGAIYCIQQ